MRYKSLFFDLDDTLYPSASGLWDAIGMRMNIYLQKFMDLPMPEIAATRRRYFEKYGTTLRGLQANYDVDVDDYLAFVHDLPLEEYIQPDPELRKMLVSLAQQRWIFTNSDRNHVSRVTSILGAADCFTGIIDIHAVDFICKPDKQAYQRALSITGDAEPSMCVIFDDNVRNLTPAGELGFTTVLVGKDGPDPQVDRVIPSLHRLKEYMPELWESGNLPSKR
jgi:putative hydrolase of the HAD superfamily